MCSHLEVLGGTNTAAYTGANSTGILEGIQITYIPRTENISKD